MREARVSIVNTAKVAVREDRDTLLARARERIDGVSRDRPDVILLTEQFANCPTDNNECGTHKTAEDLKGPITEELSALARKHGCHIAYGLLRKDADRAFNSMVLLDRGGKPVWIYDKFTPVPYEMEQCGVLPGGEPKAYDADFGRLGAAICFDINFGELAEMWFKQDIELLLFPSAFPAGRLLDSWVVRYGFALAGSTWYDNNRILDCTGAVLARTSDYCPYTTGVLNLNRRVVHMDGNMGAIDRMRTKYPGDVIVEDMRDEAVVVITSLKKGLEVKDLIREFGVETLYDYFQRSRRVRKEHGGV
ncbi:MAG: carbon-nitrogen hydrolase family protein [Candidatus Omnitrophica bacterium]|nr:carbon-nitrogen hydrolase family protein [Candidatus Omnitrophota bacterium]